MNNTCTIKKQKSCIYFFGDASTTYDKVTVKIANYKFSYWTFLLIHNIGHANSMTTTIYMNCTQEFRV